MRILDHRTEKNGSVEIVLTASHIFVDVGNLVTTLMQVSTLLWEISTSCAWVVVLYV